jgi:ectoine hydroxylase-related dioxygenase (phytanoyl-CoA dioxygenase family)
MATLISDAQWNSYDELGYLKLGKVLNDHDLAALSQRIDDIMLGKASLDFSRLLMQLDSDTGKYEDAGAQSRGHKGSTLTYRKIQDLEFDPLFLEFLQRPIFREICSHVHGAQTPIAAFRAMFMNKPARKGTFLPWHQDRWVFLDRDPLITLWTALDPATRANGCVQMIPRSHTQGLINPSHPSGFLTPEQAKAHCPPEKVVYLEVEAGESVLMHNYLLHASDVNKTDIPRRAFSVCYMDARTVSKNGDKFSIVFGEGAMTLDPAPAVG